jgi:hypothetical protein
MADMDGDAREVQQEDDEMEEAEDDGDEDQAAGGEQSVLPAWPPPASARHHPHQRSGDPAGRGARFRRFTRRSESAKAFALSLRRVKRMRMRLPLARLWVRLASAQGR